MDRVDLRFDSLDAMLEYIESKETPHWLRGCFADKPDEFTGGVATVDAACKLARNGWEGGRDEAAKIVTPLFNQVSSKIERHDPIHDIEGSQIDIAAYVDGQPECWTRLVSTYVDGLGSRIIKIGLNCGVSASVSSDTVVAKGATIAALVELLELGGYRVELSVVKATSAKADGDPIFQWRTLIKRADQDFDMARVMYALAHPSMLRILNFALLATENLKVAKQIGFWEGKRDGGYSHDADFRYDFDIYIGRSFQGSNEDACKWESPESAKDWILRKLEEAGVELSEN